MGEEGGCCEGCKGPAVHREWCFSEKWTKYFEELLTIKDFRENDIVTVGFGVRNSDVAIRNVACITKEELQEAVEVMKTGKAHGLDCVAAECPTRGGATGIELLVRLLSVCNMSGMVPIE